MSTDHSGPSLAATIEAFFACHRDRLKYVHAAMFVFFIVNLAAVTWTMLATMLNVFHDFR